MKFKIIDNCFQDASRYDNENVDFLLESDNWNDYGYKTTYHLHSTKITNPEHGNVLLGTVNIMHIGQTEHEYALRGLEEFELLGDEYCAMCQDLNVYMALNRMLKPKERLEFIESLRLITTKNKDSFSAFFEEECFQKSFLRYNEFDSFILKKGSELLLNESTIYDLPQKSFDVKFGNCDDTISLRFPCTPPDAKLRYVPNGVIAFIGKNGSGKSTLLNHIARVLYTAPRNRTNLDQYIRITPGDLGVMQLMMLSYSAFDNFTWPLLTTEECVQYSESDNIENDRFVYCGLRDSKEEARRIVERAKTLRVEERTKEKYTILRTRDVLLKNPGMLAHETIKAINVTVSDNSKRKSLDVLISKLEKYFPDVYCEMSGILEGSYINDKDTLVDEYLSLSTGHKFFIHAIAHIIAYLKEDSMVLFDEPENHLQPCLLSFMFKTMRQIAEERNSVCLIATHSPVVLQEMMSSNVFIVRKDGDKTNISHPSIQTYGANFGQINTEVFDLNSDMTNFRKAVDYMFDKWCSPDMEPLKAVEVIERQIGAPLSAQMASYAMSNCTDF